MVEGSGEVQGCRWCVYLESPEGRAGWWCQAETPPGEQQVHRAVPSCKSSAAVCSAVVGRWSTLFSFYRGWRGGIGEFTEENPPRDLNSKVSGPQF